MTDERPEVGRAGNLLGVRIGQEPGNDLPESAGQVQPGTGGMSVSPSLEMLPAHRLPRRLKDKFPDRFPQARGPNQLHCWTMGQGAFVPGPLAARLALRPDPDGPERHGFVEPAETMPLTDYEAAISATRDQWARWEE